MNALFGGVIKWITEKRRNPMWLLRSTQRGDEDLGDALNCLARITLCTACIDDGYFGCTVAFWTLGVPAR